MCLCDRGRGERKGERKKERKKEVSVCECLNARARGCVGVCVSACRLREHVSDQMNKW